MLLLKPGDFPLCLLDLTDFYKRNEVSGYEETEISQKLLISVPFSL